MSSEFFYAFVTSSLVTVVSGAVVGSALMFLYS
jgi:hypothetical protein